MNRHYPELAECIICPRHCKVNRYEKTGYCGAEADIRYNLAQLHYGEEPVISGSRGSGTIFLSHCNLRCVFCQNYNISQQGWGSEISIDECAAIMLDLQQQGAHNINLVTPAHYSVQLLDAISLARDKGLQIPIVWNTNAYEEVETLRKLEGCVDIYLPDLKYAHAIFAGRYSHAKDYPVKAREAILEMYRQAGNLVVEDGIAVSGMIIRLLVLPHRLAGIKDTLHWIADNLGTEVCISLMAQYYPAGKAQEYQELSRGITPAEYEEAVSALQDLGFVNGFIQGLSCSDEWTPQFIKAV